MAPLSTNGLGGATLLWRKVSLSQIVIQLSSGCDFDVVAVFSLSMFMVLISPIRSDVPTIVHGRVRESKFDRISTRALWCSC